MESYEKYLDADVISMINFNSEKKEKFEKSLIGHIHMCEISFLTSEVYDFISNINQEIESKSPFLGERFVTRTEKYIEAGDIPVFDIDPQNNKQSFIEFLNNKDQISNQIFSIIEEKSNNIILFSKFLEEEVYPYIKENPDITNNPFMSEIYKFSFTAKYVEERQRGIPIRKGLDVPKALKMMVTFSYNGINMNSFEIKFDKNMSHYQRDSLRNSLVSRLTNVLRDKEQKKLDVLKKELVQYQFKTKVATSIIPKWSNPIPYWYNQHNQILYVTMIITEKEIFELVELSKNIYNILNTFKQYPSLFNKDLMLTDNEDITDTYFIDENKIYIHIGFDGKSEDFEEFATTLKKKIETVILFDEFNIVPSEDFTSLHRYRIQKIDNYDIGEDRYVIYRFRGIRNRTYIKGIKNGKPMSTHQLMKSYKKRKKQLENNI